LDRARRATITLNLDVDADSAAGFPEDVESVVRDNAASLRITDFDFEEEWRFLGTDDIELQGSPASL
jgi:hypothetical protein